MRNINEDTITQAVLASMEQCRNPRLRTIMTSLVQHLHSFARDVKLTEDEWFTAVQFLTDVGHITDDARQEFILLSDVLGLSTLVTAQNNVKPAGCTEATVFGPFFIEGAPHYPLGADISNGARGEPCFVSGRVTSTDGTPLAGVTVDVWQSDEDGYYDVQRPPTAPGEHVHRARAQLTTDSDTDQFGQLPLGRFDHQKAGAGAQDISKSVIRKGTQGNRPEKTSRQALFSQLPDSSAYAPPHNPMSRNDQLCPFQETFLLFA